MALKTTFAMVKLSTVVFASAAFVFALKYYDSQSKNEKLKQSIKIDKETYANDMKEIFNRYDHEVSKNRGLLKQKGILGKEETIVNKKVLVVYDQQKVASEKAILKKHFTKKIDSLNSLLNKQNEANKSLSSEVVLLINKNKELQKQNSTNESAAAISKNLTAVNVIANGIKIVSNNIIETKRLSATEQIKVCFTLLENKAAIKGNKDIYIQIVNPNNKVVSKNGEFVETGDRLLHYSAKTNVFYDNEEMDVCVFVDPNREDMKKGDYEINIFSGITLIGNTVFSLK